VKRRKIKAPEIKKKYTAILLKSGMGGAKGRGGKCSIK